VRGRLLHVTSTDCTAASLWSASGSSRAMNAGIRRSMEIHDVDRSRRNFGRLI